jgi:hypothetical protein
LFRLGVVAIRGEKVLPLLFSFEDGVHMMLEFPMMGPLSQVLNLSSDRPPATVLHQPYPIPSCQIPNLPVYETT